MNSYYCEELGADKMIILKWILQGEGQENVHWKHQARNSEQRWVLANTARNLGVISRLAMQLWLLQKDSFPLSWWPQLINVINFQVEIECRLC